MASTQVTLLVLLSVLAITGFSIPWGFTTFFSSATCPQGWNELDTAKGRLVLSVITTSGNGVTLGTPLANKQDPTHTHSFSVEWELPGKDIAARDCCNGQGACTKTYTISGETKESNSGVPFTQLILCTFKPNVTDNGKIPFGSIGYFDPSAGTCPSGWSVYTGANGRFLVPGYQSKGVTTSDAPPLQSGQDILHEHSWNTTVDIADVNYAGVAGCCNHNVGKSGTFSVIGDTEKSSANIPYIQLMTCISQEDTLESELPRETILFNSVGCPGNWTPKLEIAGRFLVSLPKFGIAGLSFGGNSLPVKYKGPAGTHVHNFYTNFTTSACEVGLISGCCADGYSANGSYDVKGVTMTSTVNLPYLSVPACQQV